MLPITQQEAGLGQRKSANPDWSWPDRLDALVAAPANHFLIFENDRVRVLQTRIPPGQTVPLHTHRWPAVLYLESWSDFVRRDEQGNVLLDSRSAGRPKVPGVLWLEALPPHTVENVGSSVIVNFNVELKNG